MFKKIVAIACSCSLFFSTFAYGAVIPESEISKEAVVYNFTMNDDNYSITTDTGITYFYTYGSASIKPGYTVKLHKSGGKLYCFPLEKDVILTVNLNTSANVEMGYYDDDENYTETFSSSTEQKSHCTFINLDPGFYGFYVTNLSDKTIKMTKGTLIDG